MGVAAKGALGLRAFLFSTSRIFALVAFFAQFLGLMDCLAHWKAQQKPLDPELLEKVSNSSNAYWDRDTFQSLYKTLSSSEFTEYTVLSLREAFSLLIGSSFLVGLLIFLVKRKMSSDFREASCASQLQHVAEAVNFPDAFVDWDDDSGDPQFKSLILMTEIFRRALVPGRIQDSVVVGCEGDDCDGSHSLCNKSAPAHSHWGHK